MLVYIINSGTYGTFENKVINGIEKRGGGVVGKIRYLFHRAVIPMDIVQGYYPTFYKHKILLPLLPLYRIYIGIRKGLAGRTAKAVFRA